MASSCCRHPRGLFLLEVLLALAIFVMIGIAILSMVSSTGTAVARSRDAARAADLARSAMAMLEAGISTPRTLNGEVRSWSEAQLREDEFAFGFGGDSGGGAGWELEIGTEPSEFDGLTRVTVHAFRRVSRNSDQLAASYTLRQLVRLSAAADDEAGEEDPLMEEARRGAQQPGGRSPTVPGGLTRPAPGGRP
jgi:hypothetical protein